MKVFISFSGSRSRALAEILRKHIPHIIDVELFLSKSDIGSGAKWSESLTAELEATDFGILVVTPYNLESKWLHFEAGTLTKHREGRACALLFDDVRFTNIEGPLAQFQHREFTQEDFTHLMADLNAKLDKPMSDETLEYRLAKPWADMNQEIKAIPTSPEGEPAPTESRDDESKMDEVLTILRNIQQEGVKTIAVYGPTATAPDPGRSELSTTLANLVASRSSGKKNELPLATALGLDQDQSISAWLAAEARSQQPPDLQPPDLQPPDLQPPDLQPS